MISALSETVSLLCVCDSRVQIVSLQPPSLVVLFPLLALVAVPTVMGRYNGPLYHPMYYYNGLRDVHSLYMAPIVIFPGLVLQVHTLSVVVYLSVLHINIAVVLILVGYLFFFPHIVSIAPPSVAE